MAQLMPFQSAYLPVLLKMFRDVVILHHENNLGKAQP